MQALFTVFAFVDESGSRLAQRKRRMRVDVNGVSNHNIASALITDQRQASKRGDLLRCLKFFNNSQPISVGV